MSPAKKLQLFAGVFRPDGSRHVAWAAEDDVRTLFLFLPEPERSRLNALLERIGTPDHKEPAESTTRSERPEGKSHVKP